MCGHGIQRQFLHDESVIFEGLTNIVNDEKKIIFFIFNICYSPVELLNLPAFLK